MLGVDLVCLRKWSVNRGPDRSRIEAGHEGDRECVIADLIDPWPGSVDTRRLDSIGLNEGPVGHDPIL